MTLTFEPLAVGAISRVRVIGALHIEDEHGSDERFFCSCLRCTLQRFQ